MLVEWKGESGTHVAVTVELCPKGGGPLFATTLDAGDSSEQGSARLSIARLGIAEGDYLVSASVHVPNAPALGAVACPLTVTAHAPGTGALRPAHVWSLDAGAAARAKSS